MSLKDVDDIKLEYRTLSDNVLRDFYIPCLKEATTYKRAVGFFSSSILLQISYGLGAIATRGGKIKLIVSPKLEKSDYDAIKQGYEIRQYVADKMKNDFDEGIEVYQKEERFRLLSYLIAHNILDIKVAILEENSNMAMYHEKLGILEDDDDNIVVFTGSANETNNAYNLNYECIDVYCSWKSDNDDARCITKEMRFDSMWNAREKGLIIIPFPEVIKNSILKYDGNNIDFMKLDKELISKIEKKSCNPHIKSNVKLYDYQNQAIENWKINNYRGIFDMATGTGKTYTGCGAICKLFSEVNRLVVFICCPYTHLVEQWAEEVKEFSIQPIVCYGSVNYKTTLKRELMKFRRKKIDFVCAIITNSSFQINDIQKLVDINLNSTLLLVDEAHNFGSKNIRSCLEKDFPYRLALSATLERYGDELGTKKLYDFFGKKCIEYDLERAIRERKLTEYKYYPILVYLDEEELEEYYNLTEKIGKFYNTTDDEISDVLKSILVKRARIIAGAKDKLNKLDLLMNKYHDKNNLLVYCGAVKYGEYDYDKCRDEKKQIKLVLNLLTKKYNMIATKFTSEETNEERKRIIESYKNEYIQALVAIKCLDEGMNIPAIKTAFILASSTNPKEYIQRRGRVLRKYKGKEYAEIYDFITLPRRLESVDLVSEKFRKMDKSLVKKEFIRLKDFASLSCNSSESIRLMDMIMDAYGMDIITEEVGEYD